jgi:threonine/homoserine/homoserine lactone efflux protein
MDYSTFAAFWIVSILLIVTPGMDWAYVISAGMRGRVVVPAVTGLLFGHLTAILLVAAGVGALVASSPAALSVLTFAGAAYLLWIGIGQLRKPSGPPVAGEAEASHSGMRWALKGACVSGLNPKVLLLFLVLLPQFVNRTAAWTVPVQIVALGLLHVFSCGVVYLAIGFSARAVLRSRPAAARTISRVSGAAMVVIAVLLFAEHIKP